MPLFEAFHFVPHAQARVQHVDSFDDHVAISRRQLERELRPGSSTDHAGGKVDVEAVAGHRILLRSEWRTAPFLRSDRLRPVLEDWSLPPADIYAVYPQRL